MREFYENLNELEDSPNLQKLKEFEQHRCTTRFNHCNDVAVCSYQIAKALNITVDEESLMRGAMLHDYYLYDTKDDSISTFDHWMKHPEIALENAEELYDLNDKEKGIIKSHMWPLNPTSMPDSTEGWLVCIADKYCAIREVVKLKMLRKVLESA